MIDFQGGQSIYPGSTWFILAAGLVRFSHLKVSTYTPCYLLHDQCRRFLSALSVDVELATSAISGAHIAAPAGQLGKARADYSSVMPSRGPRTEDAQDTHVCALEWWQGTCLRVHISCRRRQCLGHLARNVASGVESSCCRIMGTRCLEAAFSETSTKAGVYSRGYKISRRCDPSSKTALSSH